MSKFSVVDTHDPLPQAPRVQLLRRHTGNLVTIDGHPENQSPYYDPDGEV